MSLCRAAPLSSPKIVSPWFCWGSLGLVSWLGLIRPIALKPWVTTMNFIHCLANATKPFFRVTRAGTPSFWGKRRGEISATVSHSQQIHLNNAEKTREKRRLRLHYTWSCYDPAAVQQKRRARTNHSSFLYDGVVSLLQVAVQDVTKHAGGVLVEVAGSFGHAVVLAPDRDVDALFLLGIEK